MGGRNVADSMATARVQEEAKQTVIDGSENNGGFFAQQSTKGDYGLTA